MRRKIMVLTLIVLSILMPAAVGHALILSGDYDENIAYAFNTETRTITYTGSGVLSGRQFELCSNYGATDVIIGDGITGIGRNAFSSCSIQSIELAPTVGFIDDNAFSDCVMLESVTRRPGISPVGGDEAYIGAYAFYSCGKLTTLELPDEATRIGARALTGCNALEAVTLPASVLKIEEYAFAGLKALREISFNLHLQEIGRCAFEDCIGLTGLQFPASLRTIGDAAFEGCTGLKWVKCYADEVGPYAFYGCTGLEEISLSPGQTEIAAGTFYGCTSLVRCLMPSVLKSIGESAFYNCYALEEVSFGRYVESIGEKAFYGCRSLWRVQMEEDSVTTLGDRAFEGCTDLYIFSSEPYYFNPKSCIFLSRRLTAIGKAVFSGCTGIEKIYLEPAEGRTIASRDDYRVFYSLFEGCSRLTTVEFADGFSAIPYNIFNGCASLTTVIVPEDLTVIEMSAFKGCTSLTCFPDTPCLNSIDSDAFSGSGLTDFICPASLRIIGSGAFRDCYDLTRITLNEGLFSIDSNAFSGTGLTSVEWPLSLREISSYAFQYCGWLESVTVPSRTLDISGKDGVFDGCPMLTDILCYPDSRMWTWATENGYNAVSLEFTLPEARVTLPRSLRRIEDLAFSGDPAMKGYLEIPGSVLYIGEYAFEGTGLTHISLPRNVYLTENALAGITPRPKLLCWPGSSADSWAQSHDFEIIYLPLEQ